MKVLLLVILIWFLVFALWVGAVAFCLLLKAIREEIE